MRVAVTGASGVMGRSVIGALRHDADKRVDAVIGLARARLAHPDPDVDWREVDLLADEIAPHLEGVDALVHASRGTVRRQRPGRAGAADGAGAGSPLAAARRVLSAAADAGVQRVVVLSSFAVYSPADPLHDPVDESWPTHGVADVPFARNAVAVEQVTSDFAHDHPAARVACIRAGLPLGPRARSQFLERLGALATRVPAPQGLPVLLGVEGAALPVVHHDDLASACCAAVTRSSVGAYNVALDTPLELAAAAEALGARPFGVPSEMAAKGVELATRLLGSVRKAEHHSLTSWLTLASRAPRLDTTRAREQLGWAPAHSLDDALRSTLAGAA